MMMQLGKQEAYEAMSKSSSERISESIEDNLYQDG